MLVNSVDVKRNQQRQLNVMRIRAEQQAPDFYASELAAAQWQISDLTRKLEMVEFANCQLRAENTSLHLEIDSYRYTIAKQQAI